LNLEEIQSIIDRPDFDLLEALERHRLALKARQKRLAEPAFLVLSTLYARRRWLS
jgi:hypothetical protein